MSYDVLGEFFLAGEGRSVSARFTVDPETDEFVLLTDDTEYSGHLSVLNIEPPLGRQPRKIYLPEGHMFQTDDLEAIAGMLPKTGWNILSAIEKFGPHILPIALAAPFVAYGAYRILMPIFVNIALGLTPAAAVYQMDRSTISTLDRFAMDESNIPQETQDRLTIVFEEMVELFSVNSGFPDTKMPAPFPSPRAPSLMRLLVIALRVIVARAAPFVEGLGELMILIPAPFIEVLLLILLLLMMSSPSP